MPLPWDERVAPPFAHGKHGLTGRGAASLSIALTTCHDIWCEVHVLDLTTQRWGELRFMPA